MKEEVTLEKIWMKLNRLEDHIINLIVPIQNILRVLGDPSQLEELKDVMRRLLSAISGLKESDISISSNEIKFIGNRLNGVEKILKSIQENGISKKIDLSVVVDGYDMVKKPISHDPKEPVEEPWKAEKAILDNLLEREGAVLMHRFGLLGQKDKTLTAVGKIIGVSPERTRQIEAKAIRKCRHPSRKHLVDALKDSKFKKSILGT